MTSGLAEVLNPPMYSGYILCISANPEKRIPRKGYNAELISKKEYPINQIWNKETQVLKYIYTYRFNYRPSKTFDGRSECFTKTGFNKLRKVMKFIKLCGIPYFWNKEPIKPKISEKYKRILELSKQFTNIAE